MRVIAGDLGGRLFEAPKGHRSHPMSEQIRNALFNSLGDLGGKSFLDAYSGSGAAAFEAYSRGAGPVYALEIAPRVFTTLKANRDSLALGSKLHISRANCASWVQNQERKFDIILADPPFDQLSVTQLAVLANSLTTSGIMVVSHSGRAEAPLVDGVVVVKEQNYANAALSFYRLVH